MCKHGLQTEYEALAGICSNHYSSALCARSRVPCVLCCSVTAVLTVDVLSHFLTVGHRVAALHTCVASFCVLPEDASVTSHT